MRNDLIARRPSIAAAAVTGLVWAVVVGLGRAIEAQDIRRAALLNRVATGLAIVIVAVPVGVAVAQSGRIERTVRSQWNAFVHLSDVGSSSPATTQTRLFSGAGNRYDYWRIAWHAFTANPLIGVGAGNYAESYYRQRQTQEAIENPHSLELQTLSELGLIGAILLALALALGGVALGALRTRAVARSSPSARTMMVAALGATIAWLIDTSGDWMHLLPGVTGVAIIAVAVLCQGSRLDSGRAIPESIRDGGSVTGRGGIGTPLGGCCSGIRARGRRCQPVESWAGPDLPGRCPRGASAQAGPGDQRRLERDSARRGRSGCLLREGRGGGSVRPGGRVACDPDRRGAR
jgi:uncharacterized membrane protein YhaH (DUF805 family)